MKHQKGIHHITILAGDPGQNADFYVNTLGLRLVKKSVNQDDPGTYHLFYGNANASPGSSITFFPWPRAVQGEPGTGESVAVSFIVPRNSLDFWRARFNEHGVSHGVPFQRFGSKVLPFKDPDGLALELVFEDIQEQESVSWEGTVAKKHAIRGFGGTTLRLTKEEATAEILQNILGFRKVEGLGDSSIYKSDADIGNSVIIELAEARSGKSGRGTVHHVAFRAEDEEELEKMRQQVEALGLSPTHIIDRHWFKSVYYRTPGGVLFEMATDGPGYAVDEDPDKLGEKLILPPWLEAKREMIEQRLPEIEV